MQLQFAFAELSQRRRRMCFNHKALYELGSLAEALRCLNEGCQLILQARKQPSAYADVEIETDIRLTAKIFTAAFKSLEKTLEEKMERNYHSLGATRIKDALEDLWSAFDRYSKKVAQNANTTALRDCIYEVNRAALDLNTLQAATQVSD